MAQRKENSRRNKIWTKAKWKGFVSPYLTPQDKEQIKREVFVPERNFELLQEWAEDGYKVSLSYSPSEKVYTASLTGMYVGRPNAGMTISQRHRELDVAITALWWASMENGAMSDWEVRHGNDSDVDW